MSQTDVRLPGLSPADLRARLTAALSSATPALLFGLRLGAAVGAVVAVGADFCACANAFDVSVAATSAVPLRSTPRRSSEPCPCLEWEVIVGSCSRERRLS